MLEKSLIHKMCLINQRWEKNGLLIKFDCVLSPTEKMSINFHKAEFLWTFSRSKVGNYKLPIKVFLVASNRTYCDYFQQQRNLLER